MGRAGRGDLIADHLDGDPHNNVLSNLVPSCHPCNVRRGHDRRLAEDQIVITGRGRAAATERLCENCGNPFLALQTKVKRGEGSFCSKACAAAAGGRAATESHQARAKVRDEKVLPLIRELRAKHYTFKQIAARLDQEGPKPPLGDQWSWQTVSKILRRNREH
jgi:hypothetical protein